MTILTLTPLPFGTYTGKIIVDGCMYAGTFAGEMKVGNTIINFNEQLNLAGRPGVMDNTAIEKHLLKIISAEIEQRYDCKVIDISLCTIIGTPNVQVKIQYNEDFVYKPCENWTIDSICFSERSVRFFRKIDFFECVKNLGKQN